MPIDDRERERRRRLMRAHIAAENAHDIEAIVKTFSPDAKNAIDLSESTGDPVSIRQGHVLLGFSDEEPGALENLQVVPDREHFTDLDIVVEGRLTGKHVRALVTFPPSFRDIELSYIASYRFDSNDLLIAERVVLDLGPFGLGYDDADGGAP